MSFLFFYVALSQLFLGSLAALCFRALIRPKWIEPLTPAFISLQRLKYVLPLLFLALAWLAPSIYPWARDGVPEGGFRALYLSRSGFLIRGLVYWALWIALSNFALRKKPWTGGPGIVIILFTGSLAGVDWIQSLDTQLASTMFGLIFLLACLLITFGFAYFFSGYRAETETRGDHGTIHFAIICVWTYLCAMQLIVVYAGNKPDESHWFLVRVQHGWQWIPAVLGLFQFFVPFLLLLQRPIKRSVPISRALALGSIVFQLFFLLWQIGPPLSVDFTVTPGLVAAFAALFGVFYFLARRADAERI